MTAQSYTRTTSASPKTGLSGGVYDFGVESVVTFTDPTQPLTANAFHVGQTTVIAIAPTVDCSISGGSPISGVPTIHNSLFFGQVMQVVNYGTAGFSFTLQHETVLAGSVLNLNYMYRTISPGMQPLQLMLYGTYGNAFFWKELGNMDDFPQGNITAHAGGGQANATPLRNKFNIVDTVASAGDSVVMHTTGFGHPVSAINLGANVMSLFPVSGAKLGNAAVNSPVVVGIGQTIMVTPIKAGQYSYILSA